MMTLYSKLGEMEASSNPIRVKTFEYKGYTFNLSYKDDQREGMSVEISSIYTPYDEEDRQEQNGSRS